MEVELIDCGNESAERLAARAEATLRFALVKLSDMREYGETPTFYIRTIPWRIRIYKKWQNLQLAISCGLKCNSKWSCDALFEFRLLKINVDQPSYAKAVPRQRFNAKTFTWAVDFIHWDSILNPENGFIQNDTVTIELFMQADPPIDVIWSHNDISLLEGQILSLHTFNAHYKQRLQSSIDEIAMERQKVAKFENRQRKIDKIKTQLRYLVDASFTRKSSEVRVLEGQLLEAVQVLLGLPNHVRVSLHIGDSNPADIKQVRQYEKFLERVACEQAKALEALRGYALRDLTENSKTKPISEKPHEQTNNPIDGELSLMRDALSEAQRQRFENAPNLLHPTNSKCMELETRLVPSSPNQRCHFPNRTVKFPPDAEGTYYERKMRQLRQQRAIIEEERMDSDAIHHRAMNSSEENCSKSENHNLDQHRSSDSCIISRAVKFG